MTSHLRIPGGDLGTFATLGHMRSLANQGAYHPLTVSLGSLIVEGVGDNRPLQAAAIRSWLQSSIRFHRDPFGVELIREVPEMLALVRARGLALLDCDDVSILGAALGKAIGLPARFVVLGFGNGLGAAPYRHVYTELFDGARWREMDITRPSNLPPVSRVARRYV